MKKNSVVKRGECERASEWYAREIHNCCLVRRAIRTQFQSVDFFAADVVGKKKDGSHVYIQATAGQASAVSARRKKLEKIPWHFSDTVELAQLVQTQNPANARQTLWFFRVHEYHLISTPTPTCEDFIITREWRTLPDAIPVPKEWFKAYKEEKNE
jgi:hypothetical protein